MNNNKILVVGGAGYIGSFIVRALKDEGFIPVIFDSLETGHQEAIEGCKIYQGNLQKDTELLDKVFKTEKPVGVIHFAAYIEVGESVENPQKYFFNNVFGTLNLLKAMINNQVLKIVFSSTAATYGEPVKIPIDEDDPKKPTNPYGETKLTVEKILSWYSQAYGLKAIALRYFNACGAALDGNYGQDYPRPTHLINIACRIAMDEKKSFQINGNDFPTPDGTCLRDYIHVLDLASAHIAAFKSLMEDQTGFRVYNVGTGEGYSVMEVVKMVKEISGVNFASPAGPRRPGDPARLVAKIDKIKKELGWEPKYSDLKTIVESAWKWHKSHPQGYSK